MVKTVLTIFGRGDTRNVEPNPKGTIIGRSPRCDVTIESKDVSRRHVRVFRDPFGRWIAEDLGSTNGTFVNSERIETRAVQPGEQIVIGSFSLSINQPQKLQIAPDTSVRTTATVTTEGFETEIIFGKGEPDETLLPPHRKQLNEIAGHLSELTSPTALYPELCRFLARTSEDIAIALRLPEKTKLLPKSPDILACHFGGSAEDATSQDTGRFDLSRLALRVSGKLLDSVRSSGKAAMVNTIFSSDEHVTWAAVDEGSPRAVICVPLGDVTEVVDMLYLDISVDEATPDMLAFVEAVCRQVVLARKSLLLMQAKTDRSVLDHQLSLARQIQSGLAPAVPENVSGIGLGLYHKPVIWVGGDYCDVWLLKDGRLAFAIGDICGKGLPAATAMSVLRTTLRTIMSFHSEPAEVVKHVNAHLMQALPEEMSLTLFLGLFSRAEATVEYVNAGHLRPLIVGPESTVTPLGQSDSPVLGTTEASFETNVETIGAGSCLVVFTDGITKTKSPAGEEFGLKRLMYLLKSTGRRSAQQVIHAVTEAVSGFQQTLAQQDDITVFALSRVDETAIS